MQNRTFNQAASANSVIFSFACLKACFSWWPQIAFENILRNLLNEWRFKMRLGCELGG
ncbi:MAG: hypothetical protein NTV37_03985 [Proteobacteria bacterium]|nr:hypothetical protein [Pseudomonadota bacterium]